MTLQLATTVAPGEIEAFMELTKGGAVPLTAWIVSAKVLPQLPLLSQELRAWLKDRTDRQLLRRASAAAEQASEPQQRFANHMHLADRVLSRPRAESAPDDQGEGEPVGSGEGTR
ncbi:hypothetical protein ACFWXO_18655 [Kitasatospora sp. NPDC059088]|uniref:hypothetical protein n=1 Tax=Kitasatospora sp. NPDC059088 TaxID=3346722 RepID=UPI003694C6C4